MVLTKETLDIYNDYQEWLNEVFNFEDRSVGVYWTPKIDSTVIEEVKDMFPDNKISYWDETTLVMKDNRHYVVIKLIDIADESKWIVAEIR